VSTIQVEADSTGVNLSGMAGVCGEGKRSDGVARVFVPAAADGPPPGRTGFKHATKPGYLPIVVSPAVLHGCAKKVVAARGDLST